MTFFNYKLYVSIFVILLKMFYQQDSQCKSYTCTTLDNQVCEKKYNDLTYLLQECPHNYICNWKDSKPEIDCSYNPPTTQKAYPGGYCEKNSDCVGNKCRNSICQGSSAGASCSIDSDCLFNLACVNKICTTLKTKGVACNREEECMSNLACYKGKCTEYFSLLDGVTLNQSESEFLCKSGKAYGNICRTLTNNDTSLTGCDPKFSCNYTDINGVKISLENTCECSYNEYAETNCLLGTESNPAFANYLSLIKEILNKTEKCNAEEPRFSYCREYIRNDWSIKKKVILNLNKQEIYAYNAHKLKNADFCVPKVVFGYDDTPPQPRNGKWQCPQYKCDGIKFDNTSCVYSVNPFNEDGRNATVYLHPVCGSNQYCDYEPELINGNWTTNHTCETINRPVTPRKKYPGEKCEKHENCLKSQKFTEMGYCIDGFCSGQKENDNCTVHEDCVVGTFCNGLRCQKQNSEKGFCIDQYHCQNNLGCYNNTCSQLYTLKNGTYISKYNLDPRLCEFGEFNEDTNQCAQTTYKNSTPDSNGFVKCNYGDTCYYTNGYLDQNGQNITVTKPCDCGYNFDGHAYCPLPNSYHSNDWVTYYKTISALLNNKCHTKVRDNCREEITEQQFRDILKWATKTVSAHLFYNAPQCAVQTLSSYYISFSLMILIFTLLSIF